MDHSTTRDHGEPLIALAEYQVLDIDGEYIIYKNGLRHQRPDDFTKLLIDGFLNKPEETVSSPESPAILNSLPVHPLVAKYQRDAMKESQETETTQNDKKEPLPDIDTISPALDAKPHTNVFDFSEAQSSTKNTEQLDAAVNGHINGHGGMPATFDSKPKFLPQHQRVLEHLDNNKDCVLDIARSPTFNTLLHDLQLMGYVTVTLGDPSDDPEGSRTAHVIRTDKPGPSQTQEQTQ